MKAKDITDCEICPLKEDCKGMTSSPFGMPIEPPCCSWNPDDDISLEKHERMIFDAEEEQQRIWEKEEEIKRKQETKKERARESRSLVYSENRKISRIRKIIRSNNKIINFAKAMIITNKIFDKNDDVPKIGKHCLEIENENLENRIRQITKIKKEKLKKLKESRKALT